MRSAEPRGLARSDPPRPGKGRHGRGNMARLAFKPDSSFFRKIVIGAVGTRAVCADLRRHGHDMRELERGSTDTKLWKDVRRKRVRIPDLVCTKCGLRVESRAKTAPDLSMSHSPAEEARAWDFGMVDRDLIAFPVCQAVEESYWSSGHLRGGLSYWHERNWVKWQAKPFVNYFAVQAFRSSAHTRSSTKGVTEGSETAIAWNATFSSRTGVVEAASQERITIRRKSDGHRYTWRVPPGQIVVVSPGCEVHENQVIASAVPPFPVAALRCPGSTPASHIGQLLQSRERTLRFTGVKLARLRGDASFCDEVSALAADADEDVYVRLEAASYLASTCGQPADPLFRPYYTSNAPQTQLESVIALGEAGTSDAIGLVSAILDDEQRPYFLRSAAAWSLSRVHQPDALSRLIRAFADVDPDIRDEALERIVSVGGPAVPLLLTGLRSPESDIAAGCAESLRHRYDLPDEAIAAIMRDFRSGSASTWVTWLVAHLPRERVATAIADLQKSAPHLHYAVSVLWSFVESWIARRWEFAPLPASEGPRCV